MHSVKRILTTENRTCAIRPTAIQSCDNVDSQKFKFKLEHWELNRNRLTVSIND